MLLFVSLLFITFLGEVFHLVVKYAYHQIIVLSRAKVIKEPISNFAFVLLHIFKGAHRT